MQRNMASGKRNKIKEILAQKDREGDKSDRYSHLWSRMTKVLEGLEYLLGAPEAKEEKGSSELFRYVPIALTACIEWYIKRAIQDLVDAKQEYRQNIRRLTDSKFDLDAVLAIEGRTVTIGEFVTHAISISSRDDIDRHVSAILGEDFFTALKRVQFSQFVHDEEKRLPETVFSTIANMMEMRHVYCHEIAEKPDIGPGLAYLQVADCASFFAPF